MSSPDYDAVQEALDVAVDDFMRQSGWNETGVMTHWILIGHQASFDDKGGSNSTYPVVYKGGEMPKHIVYGLLAIGKEQLENGGFVIGQFDDAEEEEE